VAWDPAAAKVLLILAAMIAFVVAVYFVKRNAPANPPLELAYSRAAWGPALREGEEIVAQVPVFEPVMSWGQPVYYRTGSRMPTRRQLALTSNGALLVASRGWGDLRRRHRHELAAVEVDMIAPDDDGCVSMRLRLGREPLYLYRVPRTFLERLYAAGARVAAVAEA
jgi:hypothetical protein